MVVLLRIALEEIFRTVVSVIPCDDLEGAFEIGTGHGKAGIAALDPFSEWMAIYIDFSGKLQRAQIGL